MKMTPFTIDKGLPMRLSNSVDDWVIVTRPMPESFSNVSKQTEEDEKPCIKFGRWNCQLDYLDFYHNKLATRLIQFAKEAGKDPYGRYFDAEPLVDFVLATGISDKSPDYMYRHYVYNLISEHEAIDVDKEEMRYLFEEFTLVPENEKLIG